MKCPTCGGKGYIEVKDEKGDPVVMTCTNCEGTGEVPDQKEVEEVCPKCDGTGEITIMASDGTPRLVTCTLCKGKKTVIRQPKG